MSEDRKHQRTRRTKSDNIIITTGAASCFIVTSQMLISYVSFFFFFNDTATTEIYTLSYTLSLHDALPISSHIQKSRMPSSACDWRSEEHTSELSRMPSSA